MSTKSGMGTNGTGRRNRSWPEALKREIVAASYAPGWSVSMVARHYDVNANQVFHWRKLYREGRLGSSTTTKLLPVTVGEERSIETLESLASRSGTMEIKLPKGMVRVSGNVDVVALRAALECLIG